MTTRSASGRRPPATRERSAAGQRNELVVLRPGPAKGSPAKWTPGAARIGIVNNMPDAAFAATERQLTGLLARSSDAGRPVEVLPYVLPEIHRAGPAAAAAADCWPAPAAWDHDLDALIVTGSEPLAATLEGEEYWDALAGLLSRAIGSVRGLLVSCLAAHAALAMFDGLARRPLPTKLAGVFDQRADWGHHLADGIGPTLLLPHSRRNDVAVEAAAAAGWSLVVSDPPGDEGGQGWGVIARTLSGTSVTAVQGHPEYEPDSLLREYRRDLDRYVAGTAGRPTLPERCAAPADQARLEAFDDGIGEHPPRAAEVAALDIAGMIMRSPWPWRSGGLAFYRNWLASVSQPGTSA